MIEAKGEGKGTKVFSFFPNCQMTEKLYLWSVHRLVCDKHLLVLKIFSH